MAQAPAMGPKNTSPYRDWRSGGLQEALGAARGGVSQLDINDLWRSRTENYSELVKLSTNATKEYSANELEQIYGVTVPIKPE